MRLRDAPGHVVVRRMGAAVVHRRGDDEVRLGTYVYVLPLRHPFLTAKAAGSLQILSGRRMLLGIGVGWLAEEFAAMDQDFGTRGARTTEAIEVLTRAVVTGGGGGGGAALPVPPVGHGAAAGPRPDPRRRSFEPCAAPRGPPRRRLAGVSPATRGPRRASGQVLPALERARRRRTTSRRVRDHERRPGRPRRRNAPGGGASSAFTADRSPGRITGRPRRWPTPSRICTRSPSRRRSGTKAVRLVEWEQPPVLAEVEIPEPRPGEVLLRVAAAALSIPTCI